MTLVTEDLQAVSRITHFNKVLLLPLGVSLDCFSSSELKIAMLQTQHFLEIIQELPDVSKCLLFLVLSQGHQRAAWRTSGPRWQKWCMSQDHGHLPGQFSSRRFILCW